MKPINHPQITKAQAVKRAGGVNALARMLGINASAVSRWKKGVPLERRYELKQLNPGWFK